MLGNEAAQPLEIGRWHEVVEDVDDHAKSPRRPAKRVDPDISTIPPPAHALSPSWKVVCNCRSSLASVSRARLTRRCRKKRGMGGDCMSDNAEKSAELLGRLERLPFSRWHRNFFILAFLGVMFDAADFALFGAALPPIAREFGLNPAQAGLLATVGLVGAFLGALFWGTMSDYIGRRTAFQATVGIFALFTGLVAAAWNVVSLGIFRFQIGRASCR